MKYHVPGVGFIHHYESFQTTVPDEKAEGGMRDVVFPPCALPAVAADVGAVPMPEAPEGSKAVEGNDGWEIVPLTAEEIDAQSAERIQAEVDQIWQERMAIATHPMYGLDPYGAAIIRELVKEGNPIAIEIEEWVTALYNEAGAREAAVLNGETLGPWETPSQKPHSVNAAIAAQA